MVPAQCVTQVHHGENGGHQQGLLHGQARPPVVLCMGGVLAHGVVWWRARELQHMRE